MNLIWEVSLSEFVFVTIILGGGAAWLAGRAIGGSWEPVWKALAWMVPLAAAVRFIHFALFNGSLLTLHYYVVDLVILLAAAFAGHRVTTTRKMVEQYDWLYERAGPFAWRAKGGG